MGADYISGFLTAACEMVPNPEYPGYFVMKPLLDWQAGHDFIDTLELKEDDRDDVANLFGILDDDELTTEYYRKELHDLLKETEGTLDSREVDYTVTGPIVTFNSGGMSWGDTPTDALTVWWRWSDEEMPEEAYEVLRKVGFIPPLGADGCPFTIVRKDTA